MSLLKQTFNSDYVKNHTKIVMLVMLLYLFGLLSGFMFLIFLFMGSYTVVDFSLRTTDALLLDGLLSLMFFLQHSIMVRKVIKGRLGKFITEKYYNAFYALSSIIVLLALLLFWQKVPVFIAHADGIFFWMLRALFLLCMFGFAWALKSIESLDALGVHPLISHRKEKPQQMTARGPYRWSRHPIYLFTIILIWACPVMTLDRLLFNVMWSIWIVIGTFLEDRDLHLEFGSSYREYSSRVPMLVPWRILKS